MSFKGKTSRRGFLRKSLSTIAAVYAAPAIVPASVLGAGAPSNRIQIGVLGVGRIARGHDLPGVLKHQSARIVAVCDLDSKRCADGKKLVEDYYTKKTGQPETGVQMYGDYREMLTRPEIDAVLICTPDHWHARPAIDAAMAGKDIYLEKPTSLTIAEGRAMSNAVHRTGRILQIGSQQRSWPQQQFRIACEVVRNGRIGQLKTVRVGLPVDPSGNEEPEMPVPKNLNYEMWLGSTPWVYYTEKRVHPQDDYSRPGWLRCEQFGAGMITGWGVHHIDIVHWGMDTEYTGPVEIEGTAEFPKSGIWDVHGPYSIQAKYANGVTVFISDSYPNGIRFEGTEGWIFVSRGDAAVTASDPTSGDNQALSASDPKILRSQIGPNEIHLFRSTDHHGNWLESIKSRKPPICPVEVGHRSCSACLVAHIAMKLKRKIYWDPARERFKNDDEANSMVCRAERWPYGIEP